MKKMKKSLSLVLSFVLLISAFSAFSVSASSSSIIIDAKNYVTGENQKDYYVYHNNGVPAKTNAGMEMVKWEWFKYNVTVPEAGIYSISAAASVNSDAVATGITVRTEKYMSNIVLEKTTTEANGVGIQLKNFVDAGYIYLDEGINTVFVENSGDLTKVTKDSYNTHYLYLQSITLKKASDSKFDKLNQVVMAKSYTNSTVIDGVTTGFATRYTDVVTVPKGGEQIFTYNVNIAKSGYYNLGVTTAYRGDVMLKGCTIDSVTVRNAGWMSSLNTDESTYLYKTLSTSPVYIEAGSHTLNLGLWNGNADLKIHSIVFDYDYAKNVTKIANDVTKSGDNNTSVANTDWYRNGSTSFPAWSTTRFEMTNGSWGRYSVVAPGAGVYAVSVKVGNNNQVSAIAVETESGYRASYAVPVNNDLWGIEYSDIGYVYLEDGENIIKVTNEGPGYYIFHEVTFKKVDDSYGANLGVKDIVINAKADHIKTGTNGIDFFVNHASATTPVVNNYGVETTANEMTKYIVSAPVSGVYSVNIKAGTSGEGKGLTIETNGYITDIPLTPHSGGALTLADYNNAGYIYLKAGTNTLWVKNTYGSYYILNTITLKKADEENLGTNRLFIPAEAYTNTDAVTSTKASRGLYNTIYWSSGETLNYNLEVLKDGYYDFSIIGAIRSDYIPTLTIDGEEQEIAGVNSYGYVAGFADDNTTNRKIISEGIYLTKGTHSVSFNQVNTNNNTWVHGFEFTETSEEAIAVRAFNAAESKEDIAELLTKYAELMEIDPTVDFAEVLYPEYSYTALVGAYSTLDDVINAYNNIKNNPMITYSDAENKRTIIAKVASGITAGDTMIVAAYRGDMLVSVDVQMVPASGDVEFELSNYTSQENDVFKLYVWNSMDSMTPIQY